MKLVIIESPFKGNVEFNLAYGRKCMANSLHRGEAPYASHMLYTQPGVLEDTLPNERRMGMEAGFAWGKKADLVAVYTDLGITAGMQEGILRAEENGIPVEYRKI
jgi:hypothetical protein